jgi:hypothetical protein
VNGKADLEKRASANRALHTNEPFHLVHQVLADRQTQAMILLVPLCRKKGLENTLDVFSRDPSPVVIDRVQDQIDTDLSNSRGIETQGEIARCARP